MNLSFVMRGKEVIILAFAAMSSLGPSPLPCLLTSIFFALWSDRPSGITRWELYVPRLSLNAPRSCHFFFCPISLSFWFFCFLLLEHPIWELVHFCFLLLAPSGFQTTKRQQGASSHFCFLLLASYLSGQSLQVGFNIGISTSVLR